MKIKSVHLNNYKRFTDLLIKDIPDDTRLVVLIGPNGSGKSSLFDAFLLKAQGDKNYRLEGDRHGYYSKDDAAIANQIITTQQVSQRVTIQLHSGNHPKNKWSTIFNIRSAYRNEADFQLQHLERTAPSSHRLRFERIIDTDQAVSDNYKRMAWQRLSDLDTDAPENTTFGQYRRESLKDLQEAMKDLFSEPSLELHDFGGVERAGSFRFKKGAVPGFHYKNLSGGEKAAFDLLLDIFVKRPEFQDAIYCIDEPEDHVATTLHGPLLEKIMHLMPEDSQLWIATHSIGFVRKAHDIMNNCGGVAFLDFSGRDFDQKVEMSPRTPDRAFWQTIYQVTLDDLSTLIAPRNVIICEGKRDPAEAFDANCYNKIFSDAYPDTLFISVGSSTQVESSEHLMTVLSSIAKGISIWRLIDRDDMTDGARKLKVNNRISVLRRREIENYLYDPGVLETFLNNNEKQELAASILAKRTELLEQKSSTDDMKKITQDLFAYIRTSTGIRNLGNSRHEFALQHLVPALKDTTSVYNELREDVFACTRLR